MEDSLETVHRLLLHHPSPALPYTDLHRLVASASHGPPPPPERLLGRLRVRPDLFKVLEPARGAWRGIGESWLEPWIVSASVPDGRARASTGAISAVGRSGHAGATPPATPLPRLRETLLGLGRALDEGSPTTLARWVVLAREERALQRRAPALAR